MSETALLPVIEAPLPDQADLAAAAQNQSEQLQMFSTQLQEQAFTLPEVAENQTEIMAKGADLIDTFGISTEFFEEPTHVLFFTSLANRYAKLEARKGDLSTDEYIKEKEFIADATLLLAQDKSALYPQYKDLIDVDDSDDNATHESIYAKYTNTQLTQELKEAIDTGLLDGVKERLGITADNEDPYTLRVLNITGSTTTHGMTPTMSDELMDKHYKDPAWEEYREDTHAFKSYEAGLVANTAEFKKGMGWEMNVPTAWINSHDGKRTLFMPLPFAEKILYKDQTRSKYYDEKDAARDVAILEHEYTHTQGGLNLDANIYFGIAAEERRAEYFSGDKHGYMDIKGAIQDIAAVTGIRTWDEMEGQVKGGNVQEFYTNLAQRLDLDSMLEFAMMSPKAYVIPSRRLLSEVTEYLGGLDGVTERMYDRQVAAGKQTDISDRLDNWAKNLAAMKPDTVSMFIGMRKQVHGLSFITEQIEQRIHTIWDNEQIAEILSADAGK
jgi:hypothetical protein